MHYGIYQYTALFTSHISFLYFRIETPVCPVHDSMKICKKKENRDTIKSKYFS